MWDHIINIHLNKLLGTKIKEFRINEHKKKNLKIDNLHFPLNNILTRLFKELKIYIRMTINNIVTSQNHKQ